MCDGCSKNVTVTHEDTRETRALHQSTKTKRLFMFQPMPFKVVFVKLERT